MTLACGCKSVKNRQTYTVQLKGGMKVTKTSEAAALAFAAQHKGATVIKPST
jgi:hypothetical protein